jgi:predicted ATPase/DNA-binding winged helix-turn-helix (wHTH) protein
MTIVDSNSGERFPLAAAGLPHPMRSRPLAADASRINGSTASEISFGPFRLLPAQRLLLEADKPVPLGSRALDILIALVEGEGELVSKSELMARVWPDTIVVEANLTVHVAALRRALRDGRSGNRFLVNIPGRGYRFVAPVTFVEDLRNSRRPAAATRCEHNLPPLLTRLIGRAEDVDELTEHLPRERLLTIVGPGGIGKTVVALAVAERLIDSYEHGICFIDLAAVNDPLLVPSALAAALAIENGAQEPLSGVIAPLRGKRMLLVLDNCEHVVAAAAALVDELLKNAPGVQILATSRERLRAEGERVYRLASLANPPASPRLTADEALCFPAVELFVERAVASLGEFELSDADAPIVAHICTRLDGIPLAIEFASARLDTFGVVGLAARLDDRLRVLTVGRRTAAPRHQTMSAALDWSYKLLTESGRMVLRRMAIFADDFTLDAAGAVAADPANPECAVIEAVMELAAKSLVTVEFGNAEPHFRLLETTRAYAMAKLAESGEVETLRGRHAKYHGNVREAAA